MDRMDTIILDQPPSELYPYRYARKRVLFRLKELGKSITQERQPEKHHLKTLIEQAVENQIVVVDGQNVDISVLCRIFKSEVELKSSDYDPLNERVAASEATSARDLVKHRFVLAVVKAERLIHEDPQGVDLANESKALLTRLSQNLSPDDCANIVFFVDNNAAYDMEILRMKIRAGLEVNKDITLHPVDGSLEKVRDSLHLKMTDIFDVITGDLLSEKPHSLSWTKEHVQMNDTCESLKRTLAVPKKPNTVSDDLKDLFESANVDGYSGHVYLDGRLSIYHRKDAKQEIVDALRSTASDCFDVVEMCVVPDNLTVNAYTDLRHEERGSNRQGLKATLGAIVRLQPQQNVAAVSVAHFVNKGEKVEVHGHEIGKCIWPERSPNDCCLNDICVIEIKNSCSDQCDLLHENMEMEKRQLVVDQQYPPELSEVFRGRNDVGYVTGTLVSVEATLPFKEGLVNACLVEGDNDIPFGLKGDSGAIIKLKEEKENKLHGFAMIFGGAFQLPNVPENTCIGILIMPSVHRFQTDTSRTLSFH